MTRGSIRKDAPQNASGSSVDYDCPIETWAYWEGHFGKLFLPKFRKGIALALSDFATYRKAHDAPITARNNERLDAKQIKRDLAETITKGVYATPEIENFVNLYCSRLSDDPIPDKARYLLAEFNAAPEEFLMERPEPKPLFTRVFYELFHKNGFNVSLGSAGTYYGKHGMSAQARTKDVPEPPFVEFVRRSVWGVGASASFCARVRKTIQRCPVCSKLE